MENIKILNIKGPHYMLVQHFGDEDDTKTFNGLKIYGTTNSNETHLQEK